MSAKSYNVCPKCFELSKRKRINLIKRLRESYGKVDQKEYQNLIDLVNNPKELNETMAEYYQIGIGDDGVFSVDYHASCSKCHFEFDYKYEQKAEIK